uniref:SBP-type domain-containing protein n=1 Tax=Rhizophora mucronata TaxID=61149 RepID=A0A2P2NG19_RHIMU
MGTVMRNCCLFFSLGILWHRFHELTEFDETKRSCRRRLAGHNERRRKNFSEAHAEGSSRKGICTELKDMVCGQVDNKERIKIPIQEHAPCKHFHIR